MLSVSALQIVLKPLRVFALYAAVALSACGGGGGSAPENPINGGEPGAELLPDDQPGTEPLPKVLELLAAEKDLVAPVPQIAYTRTMADSGVQISYTQEILLPQAPPVSIETQWDYMQDCVQQSAIAPLIIVREGLAEPFTRADDVVRNEQISDTEITSVPIASASTLHGAVIQISVTDFDGSLGTPLFNLRSILGRHLWLSNDLPERDYPFACARQQP